MSTDITLAERQEQIDMLRESALDFTARNTDLNRLRKCRGTLPGLDPKLAASLGELGWAGIVVPEAQGGLGLGFSELAVVLEELGKGLLSDPLLGTAFAARLLVHAGGALAEAKLPEIAAGALQVGVGWQEGRGGLELLPRTLHARRAGDHDWRLDGTKRFVVNAAVAGGFIVSAQIEDTDQAGQTLLGWLDADTAGLKVEQEWRADETPIGRLTLEGVALPATQVLVIGPAAVAALARAVDEAQVLVSAELLGVMEAALQMALAYMRTRVQFGKPIGSFQALQHKTTDLYVQQELTRAVLDEALRTLDDNGAEALERGRIAARCKARASDAGVRVTREVIQLHGAIGFTDEYDAGLYLKRALALAAWLGNGSAQRRRFSQMAEA